MVGAQDAKRSACAGLFSSHMLSALGALVCAAVMVVVSVAALACPVAEFDQFRRLKQPLSEFCLAPNSLNSLRNGLMILAANAFALAVSVFSVAEGCRAYTKFLPQGLSATYARCILRGNGSMMALWWCIKTGMRHEPRSARLKALVLFTLLVTPLLGGVATILAGVSYTAKTVRVTERQLNTTSIADWLSVDALAKFNWEQNQFDAFYKPPAGSSQLLQNDLLSNVTKGPHVISNPYSGTGLPTVGSVGGAGEALRNPLLGLKNVLVDPVPMDVPDLQVEQEYLLLRKFCRADRSGPSDFFIVLHGMPGDFELWETLNNTLPEYRVPLRVGAKGTLVELEAYNHSGPLLPEQFGTWWSDDELLLRTLSRERGLACRTRINPIKINAVIPANLTLPAVLQDYTITDFSPAAKRWMTTALDLATAFVRDLDRGTKRELSLLGRYVRGCTFDPVRGMNAIDENYPGDSCTSTEFDKLFMAYLLALMSVPPSDAMVMTPAQVAENNLVYVRDEVRDLSAYVKGWDWGTNQPRFVPNKVAAAMLVLCVVLVLLLLAALHAMTALPAGLVVRDTAPWAALMDTLQPPQALYGLSGARVDELLQGERERGVVLSLQALPLPGIAQTVEEGAAGAAATRLLFCIDHSQGYAQDAGAPGTSKHAMP